MTLEELRIKLKEAFDNGDEEQGHMDADLLLLEYINDPEVSEIFSSVRKWYV